MAEAPVIAATTTPESASNAIWDGIVVGAGPAGGMAALRLAQQGRRVLVLERTTLPREKACGCCLSSVGARLLADHGLAQLVESSPPLKSLRLQSGRRHLQLRLPTGRAISRSILDAELIRAAIAAGAHYLAPVAARLLPSSCPDYREVHAGGHALKARVIIACDGIRGTLLDEEPGCSWQIAPDAWMGAAITVDGGSAAFTSGVIHMHVAESGYVGVVQIGDGRLHLAAALDSARCKSAGGPAALISEILAGTGLPSLDGARVMGTPLLTRKRGQFGGERVLALGDACGYIEPFTGEGMTWALTSAVLLSQMLPRDLAQWPSELPIRWTQANLQHLGRHHRLCRSLRYLLHRPSLHRPALAFCSILPALAQAAVRMINRPAIAGTNR